MKIAFVGKGGSGKSTVSSLFIKYLLEKGQKVLAIDADINVHLAELLGAPLDSAKAISLDGNTKKIREFLKGDNDLIKTPGHFVKTTPPGKGSRLIRLDEPNLFLEEFSTSFHPHGRFMFVGTYDESGIGVSCYHTNLSILENVLSHAYLQNDEWLVCDMVAGTDAFSNSLHAQFDLIYLVVEPTPEGLGVFDQYTKLAQAAGVEKYVRVIGNKIDDEQDIKYIADRVGAYLAGIMPLNKNLRKARQQNRVPELTDLESSGMFEDLYQLALQNKRDPQEILKALHSLHLRYAKQDYIVNGLGDVTGQLDQEFTYASD